MGEFEGWAHGAADDVALAAVAGAVALLDGAHEVAVGAAILLSNIIAQRGVHRRRVDNLVHVEHTVRVPALLHLPHQFVGFLPVDHWDKLATKASVAVFAAEATAVFAHQQGCIFGHLTEELAVAGLFDVEDGTQVQFASADMSIVDTAKAVTLHHLLEFVEVFRQPLRCYGGVLNHTYGLVVALDTGEYAETGFAESPHAADVVIEDTTAVVGEAAAEEGSLQGVGLLLHTDAVELCDKQGLRLALDKELVGLLRVVVAAELKYLAVHEFDGHGVVA